MTNEELARRADLALADLETNGGVLLPEQANAFIDMVQEQPTVLNQVRLVRMNSPTRKINRLGFGGRIMRAAPQGSPPYAADDGTNDRYLAAADRSKPITAQIEIDTKEVIAEVRIPYEALEDNIEGQSFESHVMRLIAQQAALDFEEFGLWSDSLDSDAYLALQEGWMKRMAGAGGNVVDNASAGVGPDMFEAGMLAMPQKYLKNMSQMRHYISKANEIRYRARIAKRATGFGDSALQGKDPLNAYGTEIIAADLLGSMGGGNKGFFTYPQNLIFGIWRQLQVETDKDIRSREIIIVLTARIGLQVDDINATVKYVNI